MQTIIKGNMTREFYSNKEFKRIKLRNQKRKEHIKHNKELGAIRIEYAQKLKEKREEIKNGNM